MAQSRSALFTTALCGALVLTTPAFAQSAAEDAYRAYVEGLRSLGLEVSNGPLQYNEATDVLVVPDMKMRLSGSFEFDKPDEKATAEADKPAQTPADPGKASLSIEITGSNTLTGLTHDNGSFFAKSWDFSDDTVLTGEFQVDGEASGRMELTMTGGLAENYGFVIPTVPAEDPNRQISRWLPLIKASLLASYDRVKIDQMKGTATINDDDGTNTSPFMTLDMQIDGYRMLDARLGMVGEHGVDNISQTVKTRTETDDTFLVQTSQQGETIYKDLNLAGFVSLFDPDVPVTGEPMQLVGSQTVKGYSSNQDLGGGQVLTLKIDEASVTDMTLVKRDFDFLDLADRLYLKQEPDPVELITAALQAYRSFGIKNANVSGLEFTFPNPDEPGQSVPIQVDAVNISDFSSNGVGEFSIAGINASELPEGAHLKLGKFKIGDIEFAPYEPISKIIGPLIQEAMTGDPDPMLIARTFAPRSIAYGIEGLDVNVPGKGTVTIDLAEQAMSSTVAPIPTRIESQTVNASIPVDMLDEAEAIEVFNALGLETITWSDESKIYWDEATLDLTVERLMVDVQGLGRAEATMSFGNVPKALFEDPENQAQIALVSASFKHAEITFKDAGLTRKAITLMAEQNGIEETAFIQGLVGQVQIMTAVVNNPAFTEMTVAAAADFLANPDRLTITLAPENAIPVAQLVGSMASPQVLPDLLNVSIVSQ